MDSHRGKDILSSGSIFFQFGGKLLQKIYPNEEFDSLKINIIGIPTEEQIEGFIYMLKMRYTNFIIDTPLLFNCTV